MDDLLDSIDELHYEELITLNRAIVARIKELNALKAQSQLQHFRIGDQVQLMSSQGDLIIGTIVRINQKTVSLVTEAGARWKVSPSLLTKLVNAAPVPSEQGVIELFD
ncbi:MAG: hypothetical protein ACI8Z5_001436 [Lentimonas sp.]|jgi:hypothetical protein